MPINEIYIQKWKATWKERYDQFFETSRLEFEPALEDMICYAAEIRPAQLLKLNLSNMTLLAWSELLLLALMDQESNNLNYTPLWMAIPALLQLGLGAGIPNFQEYLDGDEFRHRMDYEEDTKQIKVWLSKLEGKNRWQSSRQIGFVFANQKNSIMENWTSSSRYGAFIVKGNVLTDHRPILKNLLDFILRDISINIVLSEFVEPLSNRNDLLSELPSSLQSLPLINLIAQNAEEIRSNKPTIRGPKDLDDAMTRALNLLNQEDLKTD